MAVAFTEIYHSIIDNSLEGGKYKHHFHVFASPCGFIVTIRYFVGSPRHYMWETLTYRTFASVRRKRALIEENRAHVFVALDLTDRYKQC